MSLAAIMNDETFFRLWDAELRRIDVSESAIDCYGFDGTWPEIIAQLRRIPTGAGTDGFFRIVEGRDFGSVRQELDQEFAVFGDGAWGDTM